MNRAQRGLGQKNEKGQMAVEMVLLLVIVVSVFTLVSRQFKKNQWIEDLVSKPWVKLSSLLQNGVWDSRPQSIESHPLQKDRNKSISGDF